MASSTRARSAEDSWRDLEARIQEVNNSCHKLIEMSNASLEVKIIGKIDQLVTLVTKCDAKIESYNATIEDRIQNKMNGVLRNIGERSVIDIGVINLHCYRLQPANSVEIVK